MHSVPKKEVALEFVLVLIEFLGVESVQLDDGCGALGKLFAGSADGRRKGRSELWIAHVGWQLAHMQYILRQMQQKRRVLSNAKPIYIKVCILFTMR